VEKERIRELAEEAAQSIEGTAIRGDALARFLEAFIAEVLVEACTK